MKRKIALIPAMLFAAQAYAATFEARLTSGPTDLASVLAAVNGKAPSEFSATDFMLVEDRELATSHFKMWVQAVEGVPVRGSAVRMWTKKDDGNLIQVELHLKPDAKTGAAELSRRFKRARFSSQALASQRLSRLVSQLVQAEVANHSDARVLGMKSRDEWRGQDMVRVVEVRSRRGKHEVAVSLLRGTVVEHSYNEFSPADALVANVFPMYEEVEGTNERLPYIQAELKYVDAAVPALGADPFAGLRTRRYLENAYHPQLSNTVAGRAAGFWSQESVRAQANELVAAAPTSANDFANGLRLRGKYATISIHPDAATAFPDAMPAWSDSASFLGVWRPADDVGVWEMIPTSGKNGQTIASAEELLARVPVRLPDHNAGQYIQSGFDEGQVYYAVTTLMDALNEMGLKDPGLSTDPFHAFLFDPDIGMRDNAYYTDNTINFTTYNPGSPNMARDNPTIWHELGHGIMDRLMGPFIRLADTGGLSEGMADFVAQMVVQHQTNGEAFPGSGDFRIINRTGFFLTNEVHDDGEAYGGAMNDMLQGAMARDGRAGLVAITDLTLEAMRLTRNHPALTAQDWFNHMLFADSLGSDVRAPGAYRELLVSALAGRNFSFDATTKVADMEIKVGDRVLTSTNAGSRENPIPVCEPSGNVHYDLTLALKDGEAMEFRYPVTVKVEFQKHALQGAIKWAQEAQNPNTFTIASGEETLSIPLDANTLECDTINQPDGTCKDYAYVQVFNAGDEKATAKKRFYLKIKPGGTDCE